MFKVTVKIKIRYLNRAINYCKLCSLYSIHKSRSPFWNTPTHIVQSKSRAIIPCNQLSLHHVNACNRYTFRYCHKSRILLTRSPWWTVRLRIETSNDNRNKRSPFSNRYDVREAQSRRGLVISRHPELLANVDLRVSLHNAHHRNMQDTR